MNVLREQVAARGKDFSVLSNYTPKDLTKYSTAREVRQLPESLQALAAGTNGQIMDIFRRECTTRSMQIKTEGALHYGGVLSTAWAKGKEVLVQETKRVQTSSEIEKKVPAISDYVLKIGTPQEQEEVKVTPMPLINGMKARTGIFTVVSIVASMMIPDNEGQTRLLKSSVHSHLRQMLVKGNIKMTGEQVLISAVWEICGPSLIVLETQAYMQLTGIRWIEFLMGQFSRCTLSQFYAVHTIIVEDILGFIKRKKGKAQVVSGKEVFINLMVAEDRESTAEPVKAVNEVIRAYKYCALLDRPIPYSYFPPLAVDVPENKTSAEFVEMMAWRKSYHAIVGGKAGPWMSLSAGKGVLSMSSDVERRIVRIVSLTLGMMQHESVVQIVPYSIGDIPFIVDSAIVMLREKGDKTKISDVLRIIVSGQDVAKIGADYKPCIVSIIDSKLPTIIMSSAAMATGDEEKTWQKGMDIIDPWNFIERYIYYGPYYGKALAHYKFRVCQLGTSDDMTGVVVKNIKAVIAHYDGKYSYKTLPEVGPDEWYSVVWESAKLRLASMFSPMVYCSPIIGVVRSIRKVRKVFSINLAGEVQWEEDVLSRAEDQPDDATDDESEDDEEGEVPAVPLPPLTMTSAMIPLVTTTQTESVQASGENEKKKKKKKGKKGKNKKEKKKYPSDSVSSGSDDDDGGQRPQVLPGGKAKAAGDPGGEKPSFVNDY